MAKLLIKHDNEGVLEIQVRPGEMTVGRHPDSNIHLDGPAVSTAHALIFTIDDESFIEDLKSTNGTFLNQRRIAKHHLADGDAVRIDHYELVYLRDLTASEAPPARPRITDARKRPALFVLSGPANGKRIDLTKPVTYLGPSSDPSGVITRTARGYLLSSTHGEALLHINQRQVSVGGEFLKSGDIVDVGGSRLQFHFK